MERHADHDQRSHFGKQVGHLGASQEMWLQECDPVGFHSHAESGCELTCGASYVYHEVSFSSRPARLAAAGVNCNFLCC